MPDTPRTPKAAQTRAAILATALRLFREDGYDRTTMRAVAQGAGVSLGSAYYYFASKEHLVQAFYDELLAEHQAAVEEAIGRMLAAAEAGTNTVPPMLDAVRAEATLGEICNAFKPLWGEYREPARF